MMFAAAVITSLIVICRITCINYTSQLFSSCLGFKKIILQDKIQFSLLVFIKKKKKKGGQKKQNLKGTKKVDQKTSHQKPAFLTPIQIHLL